MTENKFDYYYGAEGDQFSFIRIPKLMLFDPKFKDLSLGAKMLYGLLLDRMNNSIKHGWIDENNHVYIRYKIKDIQSALNLSENTATKYLMEASHPASTSIRCISILTVTGVPIPSVTSVSSS